MSSPEFTSWVYKGEDEGAESIDNLQIANVGAVLKHDVFGLCTLLPMDGVDAGNLKVLVNSDGSERELTSGHFQTTGSDSAEPKKDERAGDTLVDDKAEESKENTSEEKPEDEKSEGEEVGGENGKLEGGKDGASNGGKWEEVGIAGNGVEKEPAGDGAAAGDTDKNNEPAPGDGDVGANAGGNEEVPVFDKVVAAMRDQVVRFDVEPVGCALGIFKSLVSAAAITFSSSMLLIYNTTASNARASRTV
eukprot:6207140-Pleurochrysis_carterae.AAC.2